MAEATTPGRYLAYGLVIESPIRMPELWPSPSPRAPDVRIRIDSVEGPLPPPDQIRCYELRDDGAYLSWRNIARVWVAPGGDVAIDPLGGERQLRLAFAGPVMAAVLLLRHVPLLHGSAVAGPAGAILCLGHKGAGKSTLAAALAAAGGTVLSDDLLPLRSLGSEVRVTPAYPALKVTAETEAMLGGRHALVEGEEFVTGGKRLVRSPGWSPEPTAIATVVVADPSAPPGLTELPARLALPALMEHGYAMKFGAGGLGNQQGEKLFAACADLARGCRVLRFGRDAGLAGLPDVARTLLGHARQSRNVA